MKKISQRAPLGAALMLGVLPMAGLPAMAQQVDHSHHHGAVNLPPIMVLGGTSSMPLVAVTDPKETKATPPNADGAGYLKSIPGFNAVRKGGTGGDPVFRGQGGSRLNVLLDGTPLHGGCPSRMDPPTAYAFPESYDRITILKGPQAVVYGGASAATILFERDLPRFENWAAKADASLLVAGNGRNDEMLDLRAGGRLGFARALGTWSQSGDYRDGDGRLVHSAYERKSQTAQLGLTPTPDTSLVFTADFSQAEAAYGDRMMDGVLFDRSDYKLAFSKENLSPQVSELSAQVFHNYVDHVMDRFTLRKWSGGMMNALGNPDRTMWGGKLKLGLTPTPDVKLTMGVDYSQDTRTIRSLSAAEYMAGVSYKSKSRQDDKEFETQSAFAQGEWAVATDQRLLAGYRLTHVVAEDQAATQLADQSDNLHAGFVRFEQDWQGLTAYAGLGLAQRAGDYWERNKLWDVDSETTTQVDLGVNFKAGQWKGSVAAFANQTEDYILLSAATAKNIDARTFGAELDLAYVLNDKWQIQSSLALVHGQNRTEDRALAQTPPMDATLGLVYDDGTLSGAILGRAVAGQDRVDQGWGNIASTDIGPSAGFATLAVSAGWRVNDHLKLAAGVDNLFDRAYAEHISKAGTASLVADGYQQTERVFEPGRTFWAKGSVAF